MNKSPRLSIVALALGLLVLPMFASMPVAADRRGVNLEQQAAITAFDPILPRSTWETHREDVQFFLHSTAERGEADAAIYNPSANGWPTAALSTQNANLLWLDMQSPLQFSTGTGFMYQNAKKLVVLDEGANTATFNFLGWNPNQGVPVLLGDMQNMSVFEFEARIWVHTGPVRTLALGAPCLVAELWEQNSTTGARTRFVTRSNLLAGATSPGQEGMTPCSGEVVIDAVDGFRVARNHHLSLDVLAPQGNIGGPTDNEAEIIFDLAQFPSWIRLTTDSVRLNYWAEDDDGRVVNTFPSGRISQTENTRIRFKFLHANLWGNQEAQTPPYVTNAVTGVLTSTGHPQSWCTGAPDEPTSHCQYDNLDQRAFQLRLQNEELGQYMPVDLGGGLQGNDPGENATTARCCNNIHFNIRYTPISTTGTGGVGLFEYDFAYNETFPDGAYLIEFRDNSVTGTQWMDTLRVHIGGVGFELEPAPEEASFLTYATNPDTGAILTPLQLVEVNHTIYVGERTDYHAVLRNTGTTTDTFGLSVPVPGNGWSATVHPSTVTLPSGGEQLVKVQVVPPSSGPFSLAGAWKAVDLRAVSLRSDDTVGLRLNTTLTSQVAWGVRMFTEETFVEAQPLLPKVLPAGLINLGTKEDTYIVTADASDLPPSWVVDIQPPYVSAYPKSSQDFRVVVTAPAEARGGEQYTLVLRATRVADSTVHSEVEVIVKVLIRDGFEVLPFQSTNRIWRDVGDSNLVCGTVDAQTGGTPVGYGECWTNGPLYRQDDLHYDHSALYRFRLENTGDRQDRFFIHTNWFPPNGGAFPAGDVDSRGCEDNTVGTDSSTANDQADGVPDGWRFRILPRPDVTVANITTTPGVPQLAAPTGNQPADPDNFAARSTNPAAAFSGDMNMAEIVLGAHEEMEFYVELQWQDPDDGGLGYTGCTTEEDYTFLVFLGESTTTRWGEPSPTAGLRMTVRSQNDPTREVIHALTADVATGRDVQINTQGSLVGRHPNAVHDVLLERQLDQPARESIPYSPSPGMPANGTYDLRVTNTGNEVDDILIQIAEEAQGWTHRFNPSVEIISTTNTNWAGTIGPASNGVQAPRCTVRAAHEMLCRDIGVYDEVRFRVNATPPPNTLPGSAFALDYIKVTATANPGDATSTAHDLRVDGVIGGDFRFEEVELDQVKEVFPGETVSFPFSIHNIGLEDDTYDILVEAGDSDWTPRLSSAPRVRVPAGLSHHGFLSVSVPLNATYSINPDEEPELEPFTVRVRSMGNDALQVERLEFWADIRDPAQAEGVVATSPSITAVQGTVTAVNVTVLDPQDAVPPGTPVTLRVDPASLPDGWEFVCTGTEPLEVPTACNGFDNPYMDLRLFAGAAETKQAVGQFFLRVPADELTTSRTSIRVLLNTTQLLLYHDVEINLASVYGVGLELLRPDQGNTLYVAPGDEVTHEIVVRNLGLTPQTVRLSNSALPAGWNITYTASPPNVFLLPGETSEPIGVIVSAPIRGETGAEAAVIIFGTVLEDRARVASMTLVTTIGSYALGINGPSDTLYLGPQEKAIYRLTVRNNGTVWDNVDLSLTVPVAYRGFTTLTWQPGTCDTVHRNTTSCRLLSVRDGATRTAIVEVQMGGEPLPPGTVVPFTATAKSFQAPVEVAALSTYTLRQQMLDYSGLDVDGDGYDEYAIDRNREETDGMEQFREALFTDGNETGIQTRLPDLLQFLTDNARAKRTVTGPDGSTFVDLRVDGDDDGRIDFLLDFDADGLPDGYFDPDLRYSTRIDVTRDVASDLLQDPSGGKDPRLRVDGVPEYFIDMDGDGRLDGYFEITSASFGKLIQQFVDTDDFVDYVVDIDGDGRKDDGEPILFGGPGGIVRSLIMVDMDGNGEPDEVYDTNGDGKPDYFIPAGSQRQYPIVHDDVDEDGTVEWLFDADGNGRVDSYYDPDTGESRSIDARSGFVRDLAKFWYVGLIFALVLVLFVVLVAVTRR